MKQHKNLLTKGTLAAAVLAMVFAGTAYAAVTHITQGDGATIISDGGTNQAYIVIGQGAKGFIGRGGQERAISSTGNTEDAAGAIAIGDYTYARSGSIMIGSHSFKGSMGDVTGIDSSQLATKGSNGVYGHTVATTTIGTNSFTKGFLATTMGAYNIQSSRNVGYGLSNNYNLENFGATVVGTLNSNESLTSPAKDGFFSDKSYSGIANTIVGAANRVNNSNGALVYGAGNEITNSVKTITGVDDTTSLSDATAAAKTLRDAVKKSNSGGATMAFGGGNVADYTLRTQIIGVNNTIKGTSDDPSEYNLIDGFNVTAMDVDHAYVIGANDTVTGSEGIQIYGDNRKLTNVKNSVILGSAESEMELTASKATILGYNANVQAEGGVALGAGSILNDSESGLDQSGYNPATKTNSTDTNYIWRPTLAAVSVGVSGTDTRRITNVAAGINDTDAVNVAQLKQVAGSAGGSANLIAGDGIKLVKGTDGSWTISTNFENSGSDEVTYKDATNTGDTTNTDSGTTSDTGKAAVIETKLTADDGNTTRLGDNKDNQLGIKGDGENIKTSVSGSDVKVALSKDLSVSSITINNGGPTINEGGIDMNNTKITNIADGDVYEGSKDAVNGGQLWSVQQGMNGRISRLDTKINRVGAGAAALANLHPLDFDPDDKWSFSTGFGNYRNANALAVGAFYRPDEKSMVNISGTFGNGENMVGLGASFKLGKESSVTKGNLQKTITNLQTLVASQDKAMKAQNEKIAKLEAIVAQLMAK